MRTLACLLATGLLVLEFAWRTQACADELKTAETDGFDRTTQGEYLGEIIRPNGRSKLGVQVVSLGDGKFSAVWREGELPGDGWDNTEIAPLESAAVADVVTFTSSVQTAILK